MDDVLIRSTVLKKMITRTHALTLSVISERRGVEGIELALRQPCVQCAHKQEIQRFDEKLIGFMILKGHLYIYI